ncbi:2,5-dichloro-2,5-cyclohexadiene-1,4-diol dehydrogenase [Variovorax sp. SRS16]|uniref:SDR family NAD(P)-dependent oxidoreductase n=1 Tax=Variovorax sp. SRS16 TaxID=282217 RepID=UPI0013194827|nr:SDR family oxidoreductase [Variovorax sp. SRS16]VTU32779.1 2,5-dichloro-2,5-cyclohexadiene-1,4-diol dehydrogenase [Variovorax sp. SRS16]
MQLQGYHAVVTGAARGLGAAAAKRFVAEGARVVVADIDGEAARACAQAIDASGVRATARVCDIADPAACAALVAQAESFFGAPIDVFLAHAGLGYAGPLTEADPERIRRIVEVNVLGTIYCAQAALRSLVRSPRASLIFTSSLQSVTARAQRSVYTASKHAIVGLTKALALEYSPQGVRVNAIAPASSDTPFLRTQLEAVGARDVDQAVREVAASMPLGWLPTPEDFADAAVFLASTSARSITGHNLLLDSGAAAGFFRRG